jgi:hypothetical protein
VRNRAALRAVEEINRDRQSFLRQEMAQSKPGIRLWTEPAPEKADDGSEVAARPRLTRAPANADDEREASAAPTRQPVQARTEEPWSLGEDLEKYRSYAVSQGSRESGESLGKALEQAEEEGKAAVAADEAVFPQAPEDIVSAQIVKNEYRIARGRRAMNKNVPNAGPR